MSRHLSLSVQSRSHGAQRYPSYPQIVGWCYVPQAEFYVVTYPLFVRNIVEHPR